MNTARPFVDLQALKKSTDLVAVVQSFGIKLTKEGADLVGLCPFHSEKSGSFRITPSKNIFGCRGCGAGGSVIDFIMKKDGLTKNQAIDWMVKNSGGAFARAASTSSGQAADAAASPLPSLPSSVNPSALLKRVVAFYAKTLLQDRDGYDYLKRRKLDDPTMLEVFQAGYCNGTLKNALPKSGDVVNGLKAPGILNAKGNERFFGRVVVPIFDTVGNVCGIYGRRLDDDKPKHPYLPGEHKGVFNGACCKTNQTLFITEAILDAMSLWQAGFKNAVSLFGNRGWTEHHETLIKESGVREIYLCLDNDASSRERTEELKAKLLTMVPSVFVIEWPAEVKDANVFFSSRSGSDFEKLLPQQAKPATAERLEEEITMLPDGFVISYGSRRYELRAIEKASSSRLKATVKALGSEQGRFHIDTVDFYLSRSRRGFIGEAARLFREVPEVIEMDVNRLIIQLETYVEKRLEEKAPLITLVSESEKAEGLRLGKNADLVGEILRDMEKLGLVGEKNIGLAQYIGMTSRKMDIPLAFLTISSSGAGKTYLQDLILSLCPPEDLIKVTSLSSRALFYRGENSLVHNVLAIEEEAGASGAAYALRNLISQKILISEIAIKNALTGRMEVQTSIARGPSSVFLTTTNPHPDDETLSRFFVGTVDESVRQTLAILAAQRQSHTLEGLHRKHRHGGIIARHLAFQRLLRPLEVINPFEPLLTYGEDGRLIFRRDQPKFQQLVVAITFLNQMRRAIKRDEVTGKEYIETTLDDIAIANELALELFGNSLDDLPPPSRELLERIVEYVKQRAVETKVETKKIEFHRRELRRALKLSEFQLRKYLRPLVDLEYLASVAGRHGQLFCYRLLYDGEGESSGRFIPGLKDVEQIRKEAMAAGILRSETSTSCEKMPLRAEKTNFVHPSCEGLHEVKNGHFPYENGHEKTNFVQFSGNHIPVFEKKGACVCVEDATARGER